MGWRVWFSFGHQAGPFLSGVTEDSPGVSRLKPGVSGLGRCAEGVGVHGGHAGCMVWLCIEGPNFPSEDRYLLPLGSFQVKIAIVRQNCAEIGKSQGSQPKLSRPVVACAQGRHAHWVHGVARCHTCLQMALMDLRTRRAKRRAFLGCSPFPVPYTPTSCRSHVTNTRVSTQGAGFCPGSGGSPRRGPANILWNIWLKANFPENPPTAAPVTLHRGGGYTGTPMPGNETP